MATCEMCGKNAEKLTTIKVAGTNMRVCSNCRPMGKEVEEPKARTHTFYHKKKEENIIIEPIDNYASEINKELSKRGYNLHQLARLANIKESNLNKYMTNKLKPDVQTLSKIEKALEIKLTTEVSSSNDYKSLNENFISEEQEALTLGDLIKKQQKK